MKVENPAVETYFSPECRQTADSLAKCVNELEAVAAEIVTCRAAVEQATASCERASIASTTAELHAAQLQESALQVRRSQLEDDLAAQISSEKHKAGKRADALERERIAEGKIAMRGHVENALAELQKAVSAFEEIAGKPRYEILGNQEIAALSANLPQGKKSPLWQFYLVDSYRKISAPAEISKALEFLKKL